MNNTVISTA